jgi:hypothetical protein
MNADRFPRRRAVRKVLTDWIHHLELALRFQNQDCHCGELLGNGTNAIASFGCIENILLAICQSVPLAEQYPILARNQHRT